MNTGSGNTVVTAGRLLQVTLWTAQILMAAAFCLFGFMKLTVPIAQLAVNMKWTGEFPAGLVRLLGAIDMAGGLGVLLPSLTRILPRVAVIAAAGCVALQVFAILFHVYRGEAGLIPLNLILLALALFIFWGRLRKAPIAARGAD